MTCRLAIALVLLLTASAAAQTPALPADTRLDLFLMVGQSNMAGRAKVEAADKVPDPRVWMLTEAGRWAAATDPMHFDKPKVAGVGPGRSFGLAVADARPGTTVGLVPCAVGGTSIVQWAKGGKLYGDAIARARVAAAHGTFRAVLWHQGEADVNRDGGDYAAKLRALIDDFRADLHDPALPVVVGQIGRFDRKQLRPAIDAFNDRLVAFAAAEPHCGCATSEGLTSRGDDLHFDAASARELGRRYAAVYLKLARPATRPASR